MSRDSHRPGSPPASEKAGGDASSESRTNASRRRKRAVIAGIAIVLAALLAYVFEARESLPVRCVVHTNAHDVRTLDGESVRGYEAEDRGTAVSRRCLAWIPPWLAVDLDRAGVVRCRFVMMPCITPEHPVLTLEPPAIEVLIPVDRIPDESHVESRFVGEWAGRWGGDWRVDGVTEWPGKLTLCADGTAQAQHRGTTRNGHWGCVDRLLWTDALVPATAPPLWKTRRVECLFTDGDAILWSVTRRKYGFHRTGE